METIKTGYTAHNGYVFTNSDAGLYNRQCEYTKHCERNGTDVSIEHAKALQHELFCLIVGSNNQ